MLAMADFFNSDDDGPMNDNMAGSGGDRSDNTVATTEDAAVTTQDQKAASRKTTQTHRARKKHKASNKLSKLGLFCVILPSQPGPVFCSPRRSFRNAMVISPIAPLLPSKVRESIEGFAYHFRLRCVKNDSIYCQSHL